METKKHNSELFYKIQVVYDLNLCAVYTLFQAIYLLCYSPVTDINQQRMSFSGEELYAAFPPYVNKTWFSSANRTLISFIFRENFQWPYWSCKFALIPRVALNLKASRSLLRLKEQRRWSVHENFISTKLYKSLFFNFCIREKLTVKLFNMKI